MSKLMQAIDRGCTALETHSKGAFSATFRLADDFPALEGHFPDNPILPGIAQVALATRIAERATGKNLSLRTVKRVKFFSPVRPGDEIRISGSADLDADGLLLVELKFSTPAEQRISAMKLIFSEGGAFL